MVLDIRGPLSRGCNWFWCAHFIAPPKGKAGVFSKVVCMAHKASLQKLAKDLVNSTGDGKGGRSPQFLVLHAVPKGFYILKECVSLRVVIDTDVGEFPQQFLLA